MKHLELALAHFRTDKVIKIDNNGQDPKTGEFETKACYVNAKTFLDAVRIYDQYLLTGDRKNILFLYELDAINVDI